MADDLDDVDALLEENFRSKEDGDRHATNGKGTSPTLKDKERRTRSRSGSEERDKGRSREKESRHRSGSRDRESKRRSSREERRSREKDSRKRSRSRERMSSRSRDRDRDRGKKRSRSRSKDRERRRGSRDRDSKFRERRRRSPSRERRRRSPPPFMRRGQGRFGGGRFARSRSRSPGSQLTPEERDSRTVFVMQLSQRVRARDIEEFFSAVGKIRDTKLIMCNKTRRFKGIAYVEFKDAEAVPLALGLNGQKLLGVPVIVQPSQAEKNRMASYGQETQVPKGDKGPMRLYVGSLHFNITEEMLRGIFEPFGKIQSIQLITDQESGRSKGYGFITYGDSEDAKKALEQMNGFELAGRAMKVGNVTERGEGTSNSQGGLDTEELDKTGIDLGATGRLALMAKLAQGTGLKLPQAANQALNTAAMQAAQPQAMADASVGALNSAQRQMQQQNAPPIATQCFMLSNMFDLASETNPGWELEVRDDVIEEGNKHGGFVHIVVDKASHAGNVYVKCQSIAVAVAAVNALHGRWFGGKIITAAYVPLINYHNLFPDSVYATQPLTTRR